MHYKGQKNAPLALIYRIFIVSVKFMDENVRNMLFYLDTVFQASPDNATRQQRHEFQTEITKTIMEHLVAADVLLGEQAALPIATGGSYVSMANNVFYFASRVVDKLWQSKCSIFVTANFLMLEE